MLFLQEQTLSVEALDVKHFSTEGSDYLIASSQVRITISL